MKTNFRSLIAVALLSWACLSALVPGRAEAGPRDANAYTAYLITQVAKARDFEKVPRARALESYLGPMDANQLASISDDSVDRLTKLLTDDDDVVKGVAARLLGKLGKRAARSLTALQCARVLPGGSDDPQAPTRFMQEAIDNINAQIGAQGGIQQAPPRPRADAAAWSSLSFCSPTGYCVNVAESGEHRIAKLEITFNGQGVALPAGFLDAIEHPLLNDIRLVSSGHNHRLDIPSMAAGSSGAGTSKVYSLTLDQGRVVAN